MCVCVTQSNTIPAIKKKKEKNHVKISAVVSVPSGVHVSPKVEPIIIKWTTIPKYPKTKQIHGKMLDGCTFAKLASICMGCVF